MKNTAYTTAGVVLVAFLVIFVAFPAHAELTGSSNDTPEKRVYLATCQGAVEADVNAQLKAKTIDISQALTRKNEGRNKCADEARKMDVPTKSKSDVVAAPVTQTPEAFDLFSRAVTRASASGCATVQIAAQIARNETLEAPEQFTTSGYILPKGVRGQMYGEDTIAVPEGYYAILTYGNGQTVFLRSGASLQVQCPINETPRASILRGLVSFFWPKGDSEDVKFKASSHTIVAAIKGTQFAVDVTDTKDTVYVFEGTVETTSVSRPDQAPQAVTAGNAISGSQAGLESPRVVTAGEFTAQYPDVFKNSASSTESISALAMPRGEAEPQASGSSDSTILWWVLGAGAVAGLVGGFRMRSRV